MVEAVADDGVFFAEQGLKNSAVGVKGGGVQNRVFGVQKLGEAALQLLVDVLGSANKAHGTDAKSALVKGTVGRGDHVGVATETQVVVGAKIQYL